MPQSQQQLLQPLCCSVRARSKNTAASRRYTEFITRYNIYFNGDEHYKETLAAMERDYEDDYTRLVPVHPVDAYADEALPRPSGSFDRSIEKAQKAIELRSIKKSLAASRAKGTIRHIRRGSSGRV